MASGLDLVPCFNDPMPGNFLISQDPVADPKPMRLIDYEFASNNERSYELGVLFAEMFYDEQLTLSLIEQYCGNRASRHGGAGDRQPRAGRHQMGVLGGGQPQAQGMGLWTIRSMACGSKCAPAA